jgi:recombinational DNA repair protein (RecF pathway)
VTRPRRGGDLLELVELDVDPAVFGLAGDPRALGYGAYLVELVERLVPEGEPSDALFVDVECALRAVCRAGAEPAILRALELKLLLHLGYLPDLAVVDVPGSACEAYDPAAGRFVHHPTAGSVPFDDTALACARALVAADFAAVAGDRAVLRVVSRVFAAHLRRHTSGPLHSVAFLHSLD